MLSALYNRLFRVQHPYADATDRQRATVLLYLAWVIVVVWAGWFGLTLLQPVIADAIGLNAWHSLPFFAFVGVIGLIQRGQLRAASWLFVVGLIVTLIPEAIHHFNNPEPNPTFVILLVLPVVAAGVLLRRFEMLIVLVALLAAVGLRAAIQSRAEQPLAFIPADNALIDALLLVTTLGLVAAFLGIFSSGTIELVRATSARLDRLRRVARFATEHDTDADEDDVLYALIERLQEAFGYDRCRVFLLSEQGRLDRRLQLSLGQRERGSQPDPAAADPAGVIDTVARLRQPLTIRPGDVQRAHLVPPARVALVLPIMAGERVLAVLDIQTRTADFDTATIDTLELLAGQVGVMLEQKREVAALHQIIHEQAAEVERLRTQYIHQQSATTLTSSDWADYLDARGSAAIGFDLNGGGLAGAQIRPASDLPDPLRAVLAAGEIHIEATSTEQRINLPIRLRGETLGALAFSVPPDRPISERQLEMARTVSDRLAMALENNRLYEQSRAQAERERQASAITGQLLGATSVQAALELAAQGFQDALGAVATRIYLQPNQVAESQNSEEV